MRTDRGFDKRSERKRWWGAVTLSLLAHGVVLGLLSRIDAPLTPLPSDPITLRFIQPTLTPRPQPVPTPTPKPTPDPTPMPVLQTMVQAPPEMERTVEPVPLPTRPVVQPVMPAITATPTAVPLVPRRTIPRVLRVERIVSLPNVPEASEVSMEEVIVSESPPIPTEPASPEGIDHPIRPVFPTTSIVTGRIPNTVYVSNPTRAVLSDRPDKNPLPELSAQPAPSPGDATGDTFIPPRPRHSPQPAYPESALRNRQAGVIRITATISAEGQVTDARIALSSGVDTLDTAALEAVRLWQFTPARRGNVAVTASVAIPIRFRLDNSL